MESLLHHGLKSPYVSMAWLAGNLLDRGVSEILRWRLKSIPCTKWTYSLPNSIAPYKGYKKNQCNFESGCLVVRRLRIMDIKIGPAGML
jgi:hypothetical protein